AGNQGAVRARDALQPAQALRHVRRPAPLTELAIAGDVNAALCLLAHYLGDRRRQEAVQGRGIVRLTGLDLAHDIDNLAWAYQAASMGGEDTISTPLHGALLVLVVTVDDATPPAEAAIRPHSLLMRLLVAGGSTRPWTGLPRSPMTLIRPCRGWCRRGDGPPGR